MIKVDGVEIELIPYRLWAVWFRKPTDKFGLRELLPEESWFGQVLGFDVDGKYCVNSGCKLRILDEDHFESSANGTIETFDTRKEAYAFFAEKQRIGEAEVQAVERTIHRAAANQ